MKFIDDAQNIRRISRMVLVGVSIAAVIILHAQADVVAQGKTLKILNMTSGLQIVNIETSEGSHMPLISLTFRNSYNWGVTIYEVSVDGYVAGEDLLFSPQGMLNPGENHTMLISSINLKGPLTITGVGLANGVFEGDDEVISRLKKRHIGAIKQINRALPIITSIDAGGDIDIDSKIDGLLRSLRRQIEALPCDDPDPYIKLWMDPARE